MGARIHAHAENSRVRVWCEQSSVVPLPEMGASIAEHGDDFVSLGDDDSLPEVTHMVSSHYTIKVWAILGACRDGAKEVRILNRYVRWNSDGERSWIEYEPDLRHA